MSCLNELYDNIVNGLPKRPERPLDSDCCGQGCVPCVFDLYEEEVKIWEEECRKVKHGGKIEENIKNTGPLLSVEEYRRFTIESVTKETRDCYRYRFTLPYGQGLGLETGQHVVIRGTVGNETVTRQYTPVSDVGAKSYFTLLIKLYEFGKFSQYVRTWQAGTEVQIRGPFGSLNYQPNKWKKIYMLAVGTGIAPMSQVIQTVLNNDDDDTLIQLLYGCRTYEDILMKEEIQEWSRYWNFSCQFYLSQEDLSSRQCYGYREKILQGRISLSVLQETISDLRDNIVILICGTRSFEHDMIVNMRLLDIPPTYYHKF